MSGFNTVSSPFGNRSDPLNPSQTQFHKGIDVRYPVGTNITTNVPLTFVSSSSSPGGGNFARFTDSAGNTHEFWHLASTTSATPGQVFNPGDVIAVSGNSGNRTTGAHLDYRVKDANGQWIDPLAKDEQGNTFAGKFSPEGSSEGLGGTTKTGGTGEETGKPGGTNINSQDVKGQGAAGAGGSGGGAACAGAGLTALAGIAMGGLLQGLGLGLNGAFGQLTNALQQIPGVSAITGAFQQASGLLNAAGGALNSLTGGAFQALSSVGANIFPGLTNVLPGVLNGAASQLLGPLQNIISNPLSLPGLVQQFAAGGGLPGILQQVGNTMVGNIVGGSLANLTNNLALGSALGEISRNITGGISEAMGQNFGNALGGVGELFRNPESMLTYGISTLGNNIGAVATNMIATGNWDISQLSRVMAPGAIAQQIISRGVGEVTGLTSQLISNNIPIAGVNNPLFDADVSRILSNINSTGAIDAVKQAFAVTANIENLGQLTDITKMMPDIANTLPVTSFEGLGQELVKLQMTNVTDFADLGSTLLKIESGRDLNHISQLDTPMHKPTGELILKTFGYGSGTYGEVTTADIMGTPAGIVHNDTLPVLISNMQFIQDHPDMECYFSLVQLLNEVLNGQHRTTTEVGGGGGGGGG